MQLMTETMIEQRTAAWHQQRLGKVTASRVGDATARIRSGWGAPRANYLMQLVCERLTGDPAPFFANDAMRWGTDTEPYARLAYSAYTGHIVTEVGFIAHPTIPMAGASADGLVGDDGMIEMKCPTTGTHIKTLLGEPIDPDYIKQMHWNLACRPARKWCDFVSYDPRLPVELQLFVQRVHRDDAALAALEGDVRTFLGEVDAKIAALMALAPYIPFFPGD
jgi:putative phage-type endonuclease